MSGDSPSVAHAELVFNYNVFIIIKILLIFTLVFNFLN